MLGVLGGVLAFLLLAGATVAYLAYDRYTRPDRSAPDLVVDSYLRAYLVYRSDTQAGQYTCDDPAGLAPLATARTELTARERELAADFEVSWGALRVTERGDAADVEVEIVITNWVDNLAYSANQSWRLGLRKTDDEWRVCQATRLD